MKILITGFEPFGEEKINPSLEAVKAVANHINTAEIVKMELPTVFYKSLQVLEEGIKLHNPQVVICVGQAGGRSEITPERVAINIDDARIKDNEGNVPIDQVIYKQGENAYFSNLPIKAMVKNMQENGIPASISNSAGTFVCNHVMYGLLYLIDKKYSDIKGGFIHVPFIPAQVINKRGVPSMSLDMIVEGLECAINAITIYKMDIEESYGSIC